MNCLNYHLALDIDTLNRKLAIDFDYFRYNFSLRHFDDSRYYRLAIIYNFGKKSTMNSREDENQEEQNATD